MNSTRPPAVLLNEAFTQGRNEMALHVLAHNLTRVLNIHRRERPPDLGALHVAQ
jgi:hypothetical protein